jgi:hypothetical protein
LVNASSGGSSLACRRTTSRLNVASLPSGTTWPGSPSARTGRHALHCPSVGSGCSGSRTAPR